MTKTKFFPALRGWMGDRSYYVAMLSLDDLAKRVNFADEVHESKGLNDLIQRRLKGRRAKAISRYLRTQKQRFFNALVVAVYEGDPSWHEFGTIKATDSGLGVDYVPSEEAETLGFLSFSGEERLFAIDGQHRLAGIKHAVHMDPKLKTDQVAVVFVGHKNTSDGLERTRRLFTTLNKTARAVQKGDLIALDEDDVMAICTRRLVTNHAFFNRGQVAFRLQNSLPPSNTTSWTTVAMLYDLLAILFGSVAQHRGDSLGCVPIARKDLKNDRPSAEVLDLYYNFAVGYFEDLANSFAELLPVFKESPMEAVRENRNASGGNALFRPIGQKVFTQVFAALVGAGHAAEDAFEWMGMLPRELDSEPFAHVLWNPATKTMKTSGPGVTLARDLLLYMLDEPAASKRGPEALRQRYARFLGEPTTKLPGKKLFNQEQGG